MRDAENGNETAPQEWRTPLEWEERWAVLERTYLVPRDGQPPTPRRDAAHRLLAHPLVQRLTLDEFTSLAHHLDDETGAITWSDFVHEWQAIESLCGAKASLRQVVESCVAEAFETFRILVWTCGLNLRESATYVASIVKLADAFDVPDGARASVSEEQRKDWRTARGDLGF